LSAEFADSIFEIEDYICLLHVKLKSTPPPAKADVEQILDRKLEDDGGFQDRRTNEQELGLFPGPYGLHPTGGYPLTTLSVGRGVVAGWAILDFELLRINVVMLASKIVSLMVESPPKS
jgi:hypothetical protein